MNAYWAGQNAHRHLPTEQTKNKIRGADNSSARRLKSQLKGVQRIVDAMNGMRLPAGTGQRSCQAGRRHANRQVYPVLCHQPSGFHSQRT